METKIKPILLIALMTWTLGASAKDFTVSYHGPSDYTQAIQQAIDDCTASGGGTVTFETSAAENTIYTSGPVELKSNVTFVLPAGTVWQANPDEKLYTKSAFGENRGEGMLWLWAKDAKNIAFSGQGILDGNGVAFMGKELEDSYELKPVTTFDPRPHVLTLYGCSNISLRDITIRNGAYWTVHLVGCENAVIDGVNLLNNLKIRNGDGIDIDHSRHVRVSNCHITSGDDCICLKNRREFAQYGSCHDITVTNCTMTSRSCAFKIGSENMDSIYNVSVDNCIITRSNRGIGIQNRDEGTVTDVSFSTIILDCRLWSDVWWGKAEPIYVTSYPRADGNNKDANWRFAKGQTQGKCGEVSRIYFSNIFATSENGCFIGEDEPGKVKDIYLDNVHINLKKLTSYPGGIYDKRPCKGEGFVRDKIYAVYIDGADSVALDGLQVNAHIANLGGVTNVK